MKTENDNNGTVCYTRFLLPVVSMFMSKQNLQQQVKNLDNEKVIKQSFAFKRRYVPSAMR